MGEGEKSIYVLHDLDQKSKRKFLIFFLSLPFFKLRNKFYHSDPFYFVLIFFTISHFSWESFCTFQYSPQNMILWHFGVWFLCCCIISGSTICGELGKHWQCAMMSLITHEKLETVFLVKATCITECPLETACRKVLLEPPRSQVHLAAGGSMWGSILDGSRDVPGSDHTEVSSRHCAQVGPSTSNILTPNQGWHSKGLKFPGLPSLLLMGVQTNFRKISSKEV